VHDARRPLPPPHLLRRLAGSAVATLALALALLSPALGQGALSRLAASSTPARPATTAARSAQTTPTTTSTPQPIDVPSFPTYAMVGSGGSVYTFGGAPNFGSATSAELTAPVVGIAADPLTGGYWVATANGAVFGFHAPVFGSLTGIQLNKPIVGIAADPVTGGYWLVAADGGVFGFNAPFFGSVPGVLGQESLHLAAPVVGIASTKNGQGYWIVAADGGVFSFGNAQFYGSLPQILGPGRLPNKPVVGIAVTPTGAGYYEVAADGGIFTFGDARFQGSVPGVLGQESLNLASPVVGLAVDPNTGGYWVASSDGGIFSFGAPFRGSDGAVSIPSPVVGVTEIGSHDPFAPGQAGYDVAWPECGDPLPPDPHPVNIVGVTDGMPFTANPCLSEEIAWASQGGSYALYTVLNSPLGAVSTTNPAVANGPEASCASTEATCESYDWGWNSAANALQVAEAAGASSPSWWLDVEVGPGLGPGDPWSLNTAANASVIQGAIAYFEGQGLTVGIYCTWLQWQEIAGDYTPVVPTWIAGAPVNDPTSYCTQPDRQFGGGPAWLVQVLAGETGGSYDQDYAC
jgi:hypothetical protein